MAMFMSHSAHHFTSFLSLLLCAVLGGTSESDTLLLDCLNDEDTGALSLIQRNVQLQSQQQQETQSVQKGESTTASIGKDVKADAADWFHGSEEMKANPNTNSGELTRQLQRAPHEDNRGFWNLAEPPLQAVDGMNQPSNSFLDTWVQAVAESPTLQRATQPSEQMQPLHDQSMSQGQRLSLLEVSSEAESKAESKAESNAELNLLTKVVLGQNHALTALKSQQDALQEGLASIEKNVEEFSRPAGAYAAAAAAGRRNPPGDARRDLADDNYRVAREGGASSIVGSIVAPIGLLSVLFHL